MSRGARVADLRTLSCGAGWRNYYFVKVTTEDGITGWSEFDEAFGSPGISSVIAQLTPLVVGQSVMQHERIREVLQGATRPGAGGVVGQALGAIENALLDAKARTLGVPCYELLGGPSATACGSTGRIASPGARRAGRITSRKSRTLTACGRWRAKCASAASRVSRRICSATRATSRSAGRLALARRSARNSTSRVRCGRESAATCRSCGRKPGRRGHPARPELQCEDRGLPAGPARGRGPGPVVGGNRHAQPEGVGLAACAQQGPHCVL